MKPPLSTIPWLAFAAGGATAAFCPSRPAGVRSLTRLSNHAEGRHPERRAFLAGAAFPCLASLAADPGRARAASVPAQRAVGAAESKCRVEGNCLETLELDGAVGWSWGGKERCDAADPLCGPDGRLREEAPSGRPVPSAKDAGLRITDVIELTLTIGTGSNADTQTIKLGLYGNDCPELVKEMKDLCGSGLVTSQNLLLGAPVRLGREFGSMTYIRPEERIEFGVFSQKVAYARSIGRARAPDEFVPQGRPDGARLEAVRAERSSRAHDAAGLLSVPRDGIGYGGPVVVKDDEAYASAFQITAAPLPEMDREGRKVIGQLVDGSSMDLLARLAGSPPRKMLPGQNGGESRQTACHGCFGLPFCAHVPSVTLWCRRSATDQGDSRRLCSLLCNRRSGKGVMRN